MPTWATVTQRAISPWEDSRVSCPLALGRFEWIQSGALISSDMTKCRETQKELQDTQINGSEGSGELSSNS